MKNPTSRRPSKLTVTRETLRTLAITELVQVAGGADSGDTRCVQVFAATNVTCPPIDR